MAYNPIQKWSSLSNSKITGAVMRKVVEILISMSESGGNYNI